ncbi:hypothetical protein DIU36_26780 [Mucilaginibacter rubeus]|nr:hypothetical protein DIU36_26780 [Mucilaginibacter rubeus]
MVHFSPLLVLSPTTPRRSITTCIANGDFVIIRDKTGKKVVGDNTNNGMEDYSQLFVFSAHEGYAV